MHIRTWQFWIIFGACLHSFGEVFCVIGKSIIFELVVAITINGTKIWSSSVRMYQSWSGTDGRKENLIRAFEKTRIERAQRFQTRSVHDSMFKPLRGWKKDNWKSSAKVLHGWIGATPFLLESDGNLIGLEQKAQVSYPIRRYSTWRCFGRWRRNFRGLYLSLI